ncbi:MAG: hypothetical protein EAZ16_09745 [Sphingobacteriales bacterium]|nr:MAG: hypothetical protein EAZ16_09745 [Sphingobacteriales bacterium]
MRFPVFGLKINLGCEGKGNRTTSKGSGYLYFQLYQYYWVGPFKEPLLKLLLLSSGPHIRRLVFQPISFYQPLQIRSK